MPVFKGTNTGSILSQQFTNTCNIKSINLVDKSGSSNSVTVAIVENGQQVYIRSWSISANDSKYEDVNILLPHGYEVLIISSGALDYYITFG